MRKKKVPSGGAKLKAAGKRAILLGVRPEVYDILRCAADHEMRPVSQFVVVAATRAAAALLKK
jgi:uncharacterized protein (DUF1778 family)